MQKRLDELESRLLEKAEGIVFQPEENNADSSDLQPPKESTPVHRRTWCDTVSSAVKRCFGLT